MIWRQIHKRYYLNVLAKSKQNGLRYAGKNVLKVIIDLLKQNANSDLFLYEGNTHTKTLDRLYKQQHQILQLTQINKIL